MLSIPQYLIETSICLIIFYSFYHFFLQKETFFQLNRSYLLATPFLSLLIPYWNISLRREEVVTTAFDAVIYPAMQSAQQVQAVFWEQMREPTPVFSLSVSDVIMAIYLGGVFLMGFSLLRSLWRLTRLIKRGKRQKKEGFTQVELQDNFPAASFFGYIFYNQQITDEQQLILEHEKVHIRQWHSLDVLAMELVVIIKWFNPLIYFFRNALKATHEFIADQYVIQQKTNRTTYAYLLINTNQNNSTPLTNTFYSLTTKRLKMMLKQPSQNWKLTKYLLVFPTTLILMSLFSFNMLEEFEPIQAGLEEVDATISELGNQTIFEVDQKSINNGIENMASDGKLKENSQYQIQWGKYTFDCEVKMNGSRRHCNCEDKYIAKKDLKSMNQSGIKFLKKGDKIKFKNVRVSAYGGMVYCEKDDLMLSSDRQKEYNKRACIWNAFDEKDIGHVSFQTNDFAYVNFKFAIYSDKANNTIPPSQVIMKGQSFPIERNFYENSNTITFKQAQEFLRNEAFILDHGEKYPIEEIIVYHFDGSKSQKYSLTNKAQLDSIKNILNPTDEFSTSRLVHKEKGINGLVLYKFHLESRSNPIISKWGRHEFHIKNRYLAVSKNELVDLLENHTITNGQGEAFESINKILFKFRHRNNTECDVDGTWEEMLQNPCFQRNINYLQHGDILYFYDLKKSLLISHLSVILQDNSSSEEIIIQQSKQEQSSILYNFAANGKHLFKQGVTLEILFQELTQSRHGKLKIEGENIPRLDVFYYSKEEDLTKEEIYEQILEALKRKYSLTIKAKYQEQTGWFLSEGDPDKLNQLTEEKVKPNLEYFNEQVRAKGQEPLGPFNYNWFADRYLPMEYGIQVTDLTEFSGRYILPLKTKDLKSLQKQLKKDYGLILKQQTRTIPITVVRFEKEDQ